MKDEKDDTKIIKDSYSVDMDFSRVAEVMKEEIGRMTLEELQKLHESVPDRVKLQLLLDKSKTKK